MDKIIKILKYIGIIIFVLMLLIFLSLIFSSEDHDLGNGYYYQSGTWVIGNRHGQDIPDYVTDVNYNERFIIAKQNPGGMKSSEIYGKIYYPNGLNYDYYWIIDKQNDSRFGPLDSIQFYSKIKELNITLKFDGKDNHIQDRVFLERELLKIEKRKAKNSKNDTINTI